MLEAVGQLNMYLNYYAVEVNDENDNSPIALILSTDKGNVDMQYALDGLSNNMLVSKYVTYMPDKEQLITQVKAVLLSNENAGEEDIRSMSILVMQQVSDKKVLKSLFYKVS